MADTEWEAKAANLLKAELKRKGVTYAQLARAVERGGGGRQRAEPAQQGKPREVYSGVLAAMSVRAWIVAVAIGLAVP